MLVSATLIASILGICLTLFWNLQVSQMINTISQNSSIPSNIIIISILVIVVIAANGFICLSLSGWTCESLAHDLRMGLAKSFMAMPTEKLEEQSTGEIMSKLQNELGEISKFLRGNLFAIIEDFINFTGTLTWMLIINPRLTLLSHLPIILILGYVYFSSRTIQSYAKKSQEANGEIGGWVNTLVNMFPIIRVFQAEEQVYNWHYRSLIKWENNIIQEERIRAGLMSLSAVLRFIPLILLFAIGGVDVIRGNMSIGALYIFINLSGNVSGVTMNLPSRMAAFHRFIANMDRLEQTLKEA